MSLILSWLNTSTGAVELTVSEPMNVPGKPKTAAILSVKNWPPATTLMLVVPAEVPSALNAARSTLAVAEPGLVIPIRETPARTNGVKT